MAAAAVSAHKWPAFCCWHYKPTKKSLQSFFYLTKLLFSTASGRQRSRTLHLHSESWDSAFSLKPNRSEWWRNHLQCICVYKSDWLLPWLWSRRSLNIPLKGGISLEVTDVAARRRFRQFWDFSSLIICMLFHPAFKLGPVTGKESTGSAFEPTLARFPPLKYLSAERKNSLEAGVVAACS